jgi:hypothetical protein
MTYDKFLNYTVLTKKYRALKTNLFGHLMFAFYLGQLLPPALAAAADPLPDVLHDTEPCWPPELLELAQAELPPDEELEPELLDPDLDVQVAASASLVVEINAVTKKIAIVEIAIPDKTSTFFICRKIIYNYLSKLFNRLF